MEEGRIVPLITEGDEQIVRIPDPFRFDTSQVRIWREGVRVIMEPTEKCPWPPGFWDRFNALPPLPDDFELPEPLPPSPYREAVIDEFVEWLNSEAEKEKPA